MVGNLRSADRGHNRGEKRYSEKSIRTMEVFLHIKSVIPWFTPYTMVYTWKLFCTLNAVYHGIRPWKLFCTFSMLIHDTDYLYIKSVYHGIRPWRSILKASQTCGWILEIDVPQICRCRRLLYDHIYQYTIRYWSLDIIIEGGRGIRTLSQFAKNRQYNEHFWSAIILFL